MNDKKTNEGEENLWRWRKLMKWRFLWRLRKLKKVKKPYESKENLWKWINLMKVKKTMKDKNTNEG